MHNLLRIETYAGRTIKFNKSRLIPFYQTFQVRVPGLWGGFIWQRPVSILVEDQDGQEEIIPVPDVTRNIIFGLFGGIALTWLLTRILRKYL